MGNVGGRPSSVTPPALGYVGGWVGPRVVGWAWDFGSPPNPPLNHLCRRCGLNSGLLVSSPHWMSQQMAPNPPRSVYQKS